MIKKEVDISLVSRQYEDPDNKEVFEQTEVFTQGTLEETENGYIVEYEETEASGFEGCVTSIELAGPDKVIMSRRGNAASNMVIKTGEKHYCVYGTLFGNFDVGVTARDIQDLSDKDIKMLEFSYVVDVNSSLIGLFELRLEVKMR